MNSLLIRRLGPAVSALREGRLRLAGTVLLMAVTFALLATIQALRASPPVVDPLGPASTLVHWTRDVSPPSVTQSAAIRSLLDVLLAIAWVAMVLAMVTMLIRYRIEAARRGAELGIRRAVGASRRDILSALVAEGSVAALAATAAGAAIGVLLLGMAARYWPGTVTTWPRLVTGAFLVPATLLVASLSPRRFLHARHLRYYEPGIVPLALPRFQLAASLAIVMGSALLLGRERQEGPGAAHRQNGLVIQIDSGLAGNADRAAAYGLLLERLRIWNPRAEISLTAPGGLVGLGTSDNVTTDCGMCVRGGIFIPYQHTQAVHLFVSPDSFVAGGARIVSGRGLTDADRLGAARVAVVNRHLALRYFQRGEAVGRKMWLGSDLQREPYEVVGIAEDSPSDVLGGALQPRQVVYLSVLQLPPTEADLLIRTEAPIDPAVVEATIRDSIGSARVTRVTAESRYDAMQSRPTVWFGVWFALAGVVVMLTGTAGTFSAVRLWVDSLAAELSLRRAVGASGVRIAGFVLSRALGIGAGGVALGLFLYFVIVRGALTAVVRDLPIWNAQLFAALGLLFGLIAVIAAGIPTIALLRRPPIQNIEG
ncbi:MAG TPA: FtsX-like permease family protein [Gemmatimonadales bacterium]|nr:FtsX-like permease family protein [Gemmatimonadales bacterium]